MSNLIYIERIINEMSEMLSGIATGRVSLQTDGPNEQYIKLRKRIIDLAPLIGPPPEFVSNASDGWKFWTFIKNYKTYDERRKYIADHFTGHYERVLVSQQNVDLGEQLLHRDLLLEDEIGSGGFGVVYKATHLTLNSARAVKVLDPRFYSGEDAPLCRFAREADLLSRVEHPNVVRFFDAGIAGGKPFIITEFLPGRNLQQIRNTSENLGEKEVINICCAVLTALGAAHAREVYHRDIKPSNIMCDGDMVKVLDFGAGVAISYTLSSRLTTQAIGTSGYIAPELQADPTLLAPGPDLYSLGVTAHFLLTGRQPYPADPGYFLREAKVSSALTGVIVQALRPPDERYKNAAEMGSALEGVQSL